MPVAKRDLAVIAATGDADRTALLLPAANFVRESVHHADVIDLRCGLVVPRTPGLAAIHADQRALIRHQKNDVRIFRIDPQVLIIVAAGRAANRGSTSFRHQSNAR